jgi:hypothetical protein
LVDKAGGRQDAALFRKSRAGELRKLAGAARDLRYVSLPLLSISGSRRERQSD